MTGILCLNYMHLPKIWAAILNLQLVFVKENFDISRRIQ
jgi:hypothetical protein